jgi:hypothetical protein
MRLSLRHHRAKSGGSQTVMIIGSRKIVESSSSKIEDSRDDFLRRLAKDGEHIM